jgi:serine/threonine protein kinase
MLRAAMTSSDPDQNDGRDMEPRQRRVPDNELKPNSVSDSADGHDSARSMPFMLGRYEVVAELGAGAMGTVYRGRDKILDRDVAIKVPKLENADARTQMLQRFYREARAVARLNHPSICPIYDVGEIDGKVFIAMGFVKGSTLDSAVGKGRFLRPREAARLIQKICLAMQHAHDHQVVHRDLKSANIILDSDGLPVLLDFGLAMLRDEKDSGITHQGQILGSPAYMSPEQVNGRGVDHRSDIFSLGVIFYEALTGKRPYRGTMTQVLFGILQGNCAAPDAINGEVPAELSELCLKMMATSPQKRFQTMGECHAELTQFLTRTSSGASGSVARSAPGSISRNQSADGLVGRWADEQVPTDTAAVHPDDSGFSASESGDGDARPRKRRGKKPADTSSVAETQPATDPTVRSVLDRASELDWQTVSHNEKKKKKKKAAKAPIETAPTSHRGSLIWIIAGSLTALSLSILLFLNGRDPDPETPIRTFEEGSDADPSIQQGKTNLIQPKESAGADKKDAAAGKSTFTLDDLDTPP